ncbi:glutamate--cysteine ligase [Cellulomonas sp. ES6]|uniref:glutamate--cysteine ligase n=1 Tax=Cellulomonas sp. ES6 TaxID=3039384 RepID=UPI0024B795DE|nr:glutamate--cysteine ligase [Cellulomonas sp. ES6]WHP17825.1 glutamate--cysteine ligase [Cellulomonas sp. ES6]
MRTIGVEEEFLLVSEAGSPRAVAAAVLQHASSVDGDDDPAQPGGSLEKEFAQEQVETSTHPCTDLDDLLEEVRGGRWRADSSAQHAGARIAALATSPRPADPTVVVNRRAQDIAAQFARTARDQLTSGCHVHVEVADAEEGVRVVDHLRRWNPVLLALSANSPYWQGDDSGYASFRSQIWGRWPTAGPTAPFGDAATYRRSVEDLVASGTILDDGMVYFDARLSARYPTVEVRVADVCLDPQDAVLLAALVRALAETAVSGRPEPAPQPRTEVVRVATWRAARSGLDDDLLSPLTGRPAPARAVLDELLRHVEPALVEGGDLERVRDGVASLLGRGNGAQQQRRWRHEGADDAELVRRAVRATLA